GMNKTKYNACLVTDRLRERAMAQTVRVVMAQCDFLVGDIPGNAERIIELARRAQTEHQADLVVFPELALSGYPPEDLLLRPSLQPRVEKALAAICRELPDVALLIGLPWRDGEALYNAAAFIEAGEVRGLYRKRCLPNYQVFDEKRYFQAGDTPCVLSLKGLRLGVTICEDIWRDAPTRSTAEAGAQLIMTLNASPYHRGKQRQRIRLVQERARDAGVPILYTNTIAGQDELVFDGRSFAVDATGQVLIAAPQFEEALYLVEVQADPAQPSAVTLVPGAVVELLDDLASVYQALAWGVRDYVNKNRFKSVVLGLSGGIDSAVTLAVAVDALGAERVRAVMMPFRYTSAMSVEDAARQAAVLGVQYEVLPIEPVYEAYMKTLAEPFAGLAPDTTEENLQARIRGVLLMSLSNKTGALVLTTGNK